MQDGRLCFIRDPGLQHHDRITDIAARPCPPPPPCAPDATSSDGSTANSNPLAVDRDGALLASGKADGWNEIAPDTEPGYGGYSDREHNPLAVDRDGGGRLHGSGTADAWKQISPDLTPHEYMHNPLGVDRDEHLLGSGKADGWSVIAPDATPSDGSIAHANPLQVDRGPMDAANDFSTNGKSGTWERFGPDVTPSIGSTVHVNPLAVNREGFLATKTDSWHQFGPDFNRGYQIDQTSEASVRSFDFSKSNDGNFYYRDQSSEWSANGMYGSETFSMEDRNDESSFARGFDTQTAEVKKTWKDASASEGLQPLPTALAAEPYTDPSKLNVMISCRALIRNTGQKQLKPYTERSKPILQGLPSAIMASEPYVDPAKLAKKISCRNQAENRKGTSSPHRDGKSSKLSPKRGLKGVPSKQNQDVIEVGSFAKIYIGDEKDASEACDVAPKKAASSKSNQGHTSKKGKRATSGPSRSPNHKEKGGLSASPLRTRGRFDGSPGGSPGGSPRSGEFPSPVNTHSERTAVPASEESTLSWLMSATLQIDSRGPGDPPVDGSSSPNPEEIVDCDTPNCSLDDSPGPLFQTPVRDDHLAQEAGTEPVTVHPGVKTGPMLSSTPKYGWQCGPDSKAQMTARRNELLKADVKRDVELMAEWKQLQLHSDGDGCGERSEKTPPRVPMWSRLWPRRRRKLFPSAQEVTLLADESSVGPVILGPADDKDALCDESIDPAIASPAVPVTPPRRIWADAAERLATVAFSKSKSAASAATVKAVSLYRKGKVVLKETYVTYEVQHRLAKVMKAEEARIAAEEARIAAELAAEQAEQQSLLPPTPGVDTNVPKADGLAVSELLQRLRQAGVGSTEASADGTAEPIVGTALDSQQVSAQQLLLKKLRVAHDERAEPAQANTQNMQKFSRERSKQKRDRFTTPEPEPNHSYRDMSPVRKDPIHMSPVRKDPIRKIHISRLKGFPIGIITNGAVVESVLPVGAASNKGLCVGDTIIKVNGKFVSTADEIEGLMAGATELHLDVLPAMYEVSFADV